uniref:Major facilitator superfamily (MFS) profile domain-containing protein n=1 Tax=Fusarium oxysporum (strain Fo5176) TaxID=660025 RepID=A0A0D2YIV3_FUSOF
MDPHPTHIESNSAKKSRRRCRFWIDYNEEVKHLVEIDYYPLSSIITAEWASTESRGVMLSAVFSMQSVGRLLSYTVSLGALRGSNPGDDEETRRLAIDRVWRWTVGVALIPAAIAILLRLTIPETPRFYAGIMKDPRKGVSNAMKLYGRNKSIQEVGRETDLSTGGPKDEEEPWYTWYGKAWDYLTGPKKGWRPLALISLLWAIMDVPWYGLTMDLSNTLATLVHDPSSPTGVMQHFRRASGDGVEGCGDDPWNKDYWNPNNTISNMIEQNAIRSIVVVSIGSLSFLLSPEGRSLVLKLAILTTPLSSVMASFNSSSILGPNTLIFVLAAEIFPTTYRGTFNGIAAASGKVGAVIIRVIIFTTRHGDKEKSLGIRLLALMPLMLVSAWLSWYLPDVQVIPKAKPVETVSEQYEADGQNLPPSPMLQVETPHSDAVSVTSSDSRSLSVPSNENSKRFRLLERLKNIPLEDIARNPGQSKTGEIY